MWRLLTCNKAMKGEEMPRCQGVTPSALPQHPAGSGECFWEEDGGGVTKGTNALLGSPTGPKRSPARWVCLCGKEALVRLACGTTYRVGCCFGQGLVVSGGEDSSRAVL